MSTPIWHKDGTTADDWVTRFTVGDDYEWDRLLLPYDVKATRAHAWGLRQIEVLTEAEWQEAQSALDALLAAFEAGEVTVTPEDEDSHTVIERFLTEEVDEVGRKVHTGRSRNDQVLAALRLYFQDALARIGRETAALSDALCSLADRHEDVLLPGYTHLQRAMPSTVALWALGYAETLADDLDAVKHVRRKVNVSPLGSAAGYGVPVLDLPREAVADRLGFRGVQTHAPAVQLARGKHELAVAHACTQVGATCNRLASDLILYTTAEFDFVELPPEHCTGSSIMPQKQNPDVLELARAYHHRLTAEMQSLATGPSNLPGGYHRDLQHTKGAVMRSLQITSDVLTALREIVEGVTFKTERTEAACTPELLATYRALKRVEAGIPFRTAYREAAKEEESTSLTPDQILGTYVTDGSPGHERPELVRKRLATHTDWIGSP
ncbi:argininosuccinate lyase [Salinibacter sp. 10B]|uniref:argininosuccinate lyase n=1 Tax=Salinibacter sp. 10B TaxID=1923971 RepID=UPI000CF42076|nr:argininosuccinate lyase [Salinibacter sp. 10B]PQJ33430.1 argininosuccinate lyase [Salinibacter sp. 10B]